MANAAAKKAAAAKEATANMYLPILIGVNVIYILLLLGLEQNFSMWNLFGITSTWACQAYAYVGILESARNKKSGSGGGSSAARQKDLVGGVHLDLLALTAIIQFGSALHSSKWFYLLWIVPTYGGWWLYSTFLGGKGGSGSKVAKSTNKEEKEGGTSTDKREKRAQKRRQKWS